MHRYSRLLIAIHWATAFLVLAAWFTAEGGREARLDPPLLHFTFGLAVLLLVLPRLMMRFVGGRPETHSTQGALMTFAAKAGHTLLYIFLVGLPFSGWYAASRMGLPVSFLGIPLPSIAAPVEGAPGMIAELHATGGTLILILAGLHGLIALWHQFVLRDGTLRRMSPV